jgi:glycosyltransferase involved in cell wall biosynthesis
MPVRDGEAFIAEALASVLTQLAPADEVVVVDDRSTDTTRCVLARIPDPRIRVLDGSGRGVSSARNIALAAARGETVAFLDHDDLWPPHRHRTMLRALAADRQLDAVFGRIRVRVEQGGVMWPWLCQQDGRHAPGSNLGNALYRREALRRVDGFDEELCCGEDLDYFNRLSATGIRFALCDVDALVHRRHRTNATNDQRAMREMHFALIRRHMAKHGRSPPGVRSGSS